MREDFSNLAPPKSAVDRFPADRRALFDLIRTQVDERMLRVVSECDYDHLAESHLRELRRIRDGEHTGEPLELELNEVLCLFRWSEEDRDLRDVTAFHFTRAFCCATLLIIPDIHENRTNFANDSLAPLIESCKVLGNPYLEALASYLIWSTTTMEPWDEDFPFHAFGLLIVADLLGERTDDLLRWNTVISDEVLPWHERQANEPVKTFLHIPYSTLAQRKWKSFARDFLTRNPDVDLPFIKAVSGPDLEDRWTDTRRKASLTGSLLKFVWHMLKPGRRG